MQNARFISPQSPVFAPTHPELRRGARTAATDPSGFVLLPFRGRKRRSSPRTPKSGVAEIFDGIIIPRKLTQLFFSSFPSFPSVHIPLSRPLSSVFSGSPARERGW
jgi:hypothetical protein